MDVREDGAIVVHAAETPAEVNLWQGTNPQGAGLPRRHHRRGLHRNAAGQARRRKLDWQGEAPPAGFTAYFVELVFSGATRSPFKFTTEVSVTPDVLPFGWEDARAITAPAT